MGQPLVARILVDVDAKALEESEALNELIGRLQPAVLAELASRGFKDGDCGDLVFGGEYGWDGRLSYWMAPREGTNYLFSADLIDLETPQLVILVNASLEEKPAVEGKAAGKGKAVTPKTETVWEYSVVVFAKTQTYRVGKLKFSIKPKDEYTRLQRVSDLLPMFTGKQKDGAR